MTVIATDGCTIAADGLKMLQNAIVQLDTPKLRRLSSGAIVGCAGESTEAIVFADWLEAGGDQAKWPKLKQLDALVLNPDGTIDVYEEVNEGRAERMKPPMAIGSGMDFAMGALFVGATAAQAVEAATRLSQTCGGRITVMSIE